MISIRLGNVGSGKTACAVREMALNPSKTIYSNIKTTLPNTHILTKDMILKRTVIGRMKTGKEVIDLKVNVDFWKSIHQPIDVYLDEAHAIGLDARRSMSKTNVIMLQWLSLIRRVVGENASGSGKLVLITQLPNRIDSFSRDLATNVRWHLCQYIKTCQRCQYSWQETSDHPEPVWNCPRCKHHEIRKHSHQIQVWHFASMALFEAWKIFGAQTFHRHSTITHIHTFFDLYDTFSWDNMFSDVYD